VGGKSSRNKGHSFERHIARIFRELYSESRRHLEYHVADAAEGTDVHAGPFNIQCKRNKKYCSISKIFEVNTNKGVPLLVSKGDRQPEMVVISLDAFMEILKRSDYGYKDTRISSRRGQEDASGQGPA